MAHSINLLPHEKSSIDLHSVGLVSFTVLLIVLIIGLSLGSVYLRFAAQSLQQQAQLKRKERNSLKEAINHASQLQQKLATILDRKESYQSLQDKTLAYGQVLDEITAALPAQTKITNLSIKGEQEITINGEALDRAQVTHFVDQLNQGKAFSSVVLSQANTSGSATQYSISLQLPKKDKERTKQ